MTVSVGNDRDVDRLTPSGWPVWSQSNGRRFLWPNGTAAIVAVSASFTRPAFPVPAKFDSTITPFTVQTSCIAANVNCSVVILADLVRVDTLLPGRPFKQKLHKGLAYPLFTPGDVVQKTVKLRVDFDSERQLYGLVVDVFVTISVDGEYLCFHARL